MRFGVNVPASAAPGSDPVGLALTAERLGFDFVSSSDHPSGTTPTNETWTMLSFIAARTERIGIATRVLGVPYRAPAMVAKMAETLDRLSGGRLILGLGGGSADDEHRAFGLGVRTPRDKIDGLAETLTIIRGLWSEPAYTFTGRLYHTDGADLEPKPSRRIPIWLGTFGPRALAVTGRLADGWIPSLGYASFDDLSSMRERVLSAAHEAGRDPDEITCALNLGVRIGQRRSTDEDAGIVAGSAQEIAETISELARTGFSAFNFMVRGDDADEQLERIAREVTPLVTIS